MSINVTIAFEYEKETKGAVRYKELPSPGTEPIVGTTYIRKVALSGNKPPAKLAIHIIGE